MYAQLAVSDEPIPVLVTSKFGLNPTADPVNFALADPTAPAPTQVAITLAATWFTDAQGQFWAMCPCGPNSAYVPVEGTVKALYLKIGDTSTLVLGPVTVQFT